MRLNQDLREIPPRLRMLSRAAGTTPDEFLKNVLASSATYAEAAYKLEITEPTLLRWRKSVLGEGEEPGGNE